MDNEDFDDYLFLPIPLPIHKKDSIIHSTNDEIESGDFVTLERTITKTACIETIMTFSGITITRYIYR